MSQLCSCLFFFNNFFFQYSLRETDPTKGCSFRLPKLNEIEQHRIVVTTLGTTSYLLRAGVKKGKANLNEDYRYILLIETSFYRLLYTHLNR